MPGDLGDAAARFVGQSGGAPDAYFSGFTWQVGRGSVRLFRIHRETGETEVNWAEAERAATRDDGSQYLPRLLIAIRDGKCTTVG